MSSVCGMQSSVFSFKQTLQHIQRVESWREYDFGKLQETLTRAQKTYEEVEKDETQMLHADGSQPLEPYNSLTTLL